MSLSDNFDNPAWPPISCVHRMLIAADADVRTRFAAGILACLTAFLTACLPGTGQGNRFMNKSIRTTEFFKDGYLLIA